MKLSFQPGLQLWVHNCLSCFCSCHGDSTKQLFTCLLKQLICHPLTTKTLRAAHGYHKTISDPILSFNRMKEEIAHSSRKAFFEKIQGHRSDSCQLRWKEVKDIPGETLWEGRNQLGSLHPTSQDKNRYGMADDLYQFTSALGCVGSGADDKHFVAITG